VTADVPLTYMDAEILSAICGNRRPIKLVQIINGVYFHNGEIPTFDQASFGLARLMTAGYIKTIDSNEAGIWVKATGRCLRLARAAERRRLERWPNHSWARDGERSAAFAELVGASVQSALNEVGDQSVGRIPNLTEDAFQSIVNAWLRDTRSMRRSVRIGRLIRRLLRKGRPQAVLFPPGS
jgi:hypothetical protein